MFILRSNHKFRNSDNADVKNFRIELEHFLLDNRIAPVKFNLDIGIKNYHFAGQAFDLISSIVGKSAACPKCSSNSLAAIRLPSGNG